MAKSKLLAALAVEKGTDFAKLKQKRKHKQNLKLRNKTNGGAPPPKDEDQWEDEEEDGDDDDDEDDNVSPLITDMVSEDCDEDEEEEDSENEGARVDIDALDDSESSDSEVEMDEKIKPSTVLKSKSSQKPHPPVGDGSAEEDDEEEEEEDDEDIPMSDLEDLDEEDREDLLPYQRETINNTRALLASLNRIRIPTGSDVAFATHMSVVSSKPTEIDDVQDDLTRELAFYSQSLEAAKKGRVQLLKEKVPFSRPTDYFAEMVKDDGHMERIKAKLIEEASAKKASAEARKQRDLKKFGKQVQAAKLQERAKAKKDMLEKIKVLKRKRQESSNDLLTHEADLFDVAVDDEIKKHNSRKKSSAGGAGGEAPNAKRQKKNEKYGFGGKKRHAKSGDAVSAGDLSGFSVNRMKGRGGGPKGKAGKAPRPGKARRKTAAARR